MLELLVRLKTWLGLRFVLRLLLLLLLQLQPLLGN